MRIFLLVFSINLMGLLAGSLVQSNRAFSAILKLPHREAKLPNGLRLFMVKYPSPRVVAYQLAVHVGSRHEIEKGKTGFAHFFEHLMFRGTKNRNAKEFGQLYVKLGCENNAWTDFDMTDYHGVVASEYLPRILEAEADRFANLEFDEKALRDEAGAVLGEYNKDAAQPEFLLEEKLMSTAFQKHPYAHTTMGYKEDILKFGERYQDVWPFFKRYYRPGNVTIVLVGDIDFNAVTALVREKFGKWRDPSLPPLEIPVEPQQTQPRFAEIKLEKTTQTRVTVAYKVPAFSTKSREAASLALLAEMLFSATSDFQKEYHFKRQWIDGIAADPHESVDPGIWSIQLRLSAAGEKKEKELIAAIEQKIAQARSGLADKERLEATKKRFRNAALTMWFGTPGHLASRIAWYANFESDFGVVERVFERLSEVQLDDLSGFARRYLVDSGKTIVVLRGATQ